MRVKKSEEITHRDHFGLRSGPSEEIRLRRELATCVEHLLSSAFAPQIGLRSPRQQAVNRVRIAPLGCSGVGGNRSARVGYALPLTA